LLIVSGDYPVIELDRRTLSEMRCEKQLAIVPGATHLFEDPGALEEVSKMALDWFHNHMAAG
jgi:putative phosphoribosyl transferase